MNGTDEARSPFWQWGDVAFYLTLLAFAVWRRPHTQTLVVAVVVAAVSFPLWILARLQLGSAFSFRASAPRRLVTAGLYARIRHPVYVFGSIAGLVSVLALQVWWLLALALLDCCSRCLRDGRRLATGPTARRPASRSTREGGS